MSAMLYERCSFCNGTRITRQDITKPTGTVIPAGSVCPLCKDGYSVVGMTVGQLERLQDQRDALLVFAADVAQHPCPNLNEWLALKEQAIKLVPNLAEADDARLRKRT